MTFTKTITASVALCIAASTTQAGGLAEPVMTMEPVAIAPAETNDRDFIIPLIFIALIGLGLSGTTGGIVPN